MNIIQDKIKYIIENGIIVKWFGKSPFDVPFFNGNSVVESITQEQIDELVEQEVNVLIDQDLNTKEDDGVALFIKLRNLIKKHHNLPDVDSENITDSQYKEIRIVLRPVLKFLKTGDWDIAQDNINNITPPINVNMLLLYNFIKNKIGTYVTNNY